MAFDKRKSLQQALAYTQHGRWEKAIAEYQEILKADPNDFSIYNTLGDLYARRGATTEAIAVYLKLGELLRTDGLAVKAIAVYKKIIKIDATNIAAYLACGDLYAEQGLAGEAKVQYMTAAEHYGKTGSTKNALQIYQKISDLDPSNYSVASKLAEMMAKEGMTKEAVAQLSRGAEGAMKNGQTGEAVRFYSRMVQLAPKSAEAHVGLGRLRIQVGEYDEAAKELKTAATLDAQNPAPLLLLAEMHQKRKRPIEAEDSLREAISRDTRSVDAHMALIQFLAAQEKADTLVAEITSCADLLRTGKKGEAVLTILRECARQNPDLPSLPETMALLYEKEGRTGEAVAAYRAAAQLFEQQNDQTQSREMYWKIGVLDPQSAEAAQKSVVSPPPSPAPVAPPSPPSSRVVSRPESPPEEEVETGEPLTPLGAAAPEEEGVVNEVEVYLKYGLVERARERLNRALEDAPQSLTFRRLRQEIYRQRAQFREAASEGVSLAETLTARGERERALTLVEESLRFDPTNREAQSLRESLTGVPHRKGRPPSAPPDEGVSADLLWEGKEAVSRVTGEVSREEEGEPVVIGPPGEKTAAEKVSELFADILSQEPEESEREEKAGVIELPAGDEFPEQLQALIERDARGSPEESEEIEVLSAPGGDMTMAEELAEVDFYIDQGMLDEARALCLRLLARAPGHPEVHSRLDQVTRARTEGAAARERGSEAQETADFSLSLPEVDRGEEPGERAVQTVDEGDLLGSLAGELREILGLPREEAVPPLPVPSPGEVTPVFTVTSGVEDPGEEGFVNLSAGLTDGAPSSPPSRQEKTGLMLEEILHEFRKGVRENLDAEDYDTHYNLGIAYKDMELFDEAIEEFRLAGRGPRFSLSCSNLIGLCYLAKGKVEEAIEEIERGLLNTGFSPAEYHGLKYDLAIAYELLGNLPRAQTLWREIKAEDPSFRDVALRIQESSPEWPERPRAGTKAPVPPPRQKKEGKISFL